MAIRADVIVSGTNTVGQFNGGGTQYVVQTPTGVMYLFVIDTGIDVAFKKSTDGGLSWSTPTIIISGSISALSIWYDRWSGISAGLIHCAYTETGVDDTFYRSVNTESSDALSTQTTIFAGATAAAGGMLSITRARGGNLYCRTCINAGTEGGFYRSTDTGATWGVRTIDETLATTDQMILMPGWNSDTQDIIGIFWDASADELSRKLYDDSANTWFETSLATSMVDQVAATAFPHFATTIDLANTRTIAVAWSAVDTANADLRCWTFTGNNSTIAEVTNVVLNSTDDQGLAGIGIDTNTGYWYVFYAGKSDGSETFLTSVNIYYKVSTDSGTTWGAETQLTNSAKNIKWLCCTPRFASKFVVAYHNDIALDEILVSASTTLPRASFRIGI